MKSKNQIRDVFQNFASNHLQINQFGYGQEFEQQAVEGVLYPLMWVVPTPYQINEVDNLWAFQVIIADRVRKDETNEMDVESDTDLIMHDCISYLDKFCYQNDLELQRQFTINPFWEKWSDEVTGVFTDIIIKDTFNYEACELPLEGEIPSNFFPDVNGVYVSPYVKDKSLVIPSPELTDDVPMFRTYTQISVRQINDVIEGTGQLVSYNVYYAATKDEVNPTKLWTVDRTITTESGGQTQTFDNPLIPKDNWVWVKFSDITGTVNIFSLDIFYKKII